MALSIAKSSAATSGKVNKKIEGKDKYNQMLFLSQFGFRYQLVDDAYVFSWPKTLLPEMLMVCLSIVQLFVTALVIKACDDPDWEIKRTLTRQIPI